MALTQDPTLSITHWFHALQGGDEAAAERLWHSFFDRIVRHAKSKLVNDAAYDEEDLALSVFVSLNSAAQSGRLKGVANRNDLWALLIVMARDKMIDRLRRRNAQKRSRNQVDAELDQMLGDDADPFSSVAVRDECAHLVSLLEREDLKRIALLRLDGFTIQEIVEATGISKRSVIRKMHRIRAAWESEAKARGLVDLDGTGSSWNPVPS